MARKPSASAAAAAAADQDSTAATAKAAELLAAAADCEGIHGHSLFFDALVQLIPSRFYLSADDEDRPYYQGLSKTAKAAMKAQTRANIKAARRARLDPEGPPSSTLDLLKKSIADQEAEEKKEEEEEEGQDKSQDESQESDDHATSDGGDDDQDNEEGDEDEDEDEEEGEEEDDKEEMPMAPAAVVSEDKSVTYEELRERLHRRITELRGNRCTRPEFLNKPQKEKGKKAKVTKVKGKKDEGTKRKREDGTEDAEGKDGKKHKRETEEKAQDIMYGNVLVDPKEARRRKKRRIKNKKKELEQAKRMQRAKEDPKKATKMAWDVATRRAAGEKVHDNPKLIKESMKKDKKRQQKHAEEWKDRQRTVDIKKKQKQTKRKENIQGRAQEKKARKIEKREKKLMRPGFEGRKEGYVNE